jgi:hypothetical protein
MKLIYILTGLIITALLIMPVFADSQSTSTTVSGSDNTITNTNSNPVTNTYNTQNTATSSNTVTGNGNSASNTNINTEGGTNVNNYGSTTNNGATAVSNEQSVNVIIPQSASYYTLNLGTTQTEIVSLFQGEVYVADNGITLTGNPQIQVAGDTYRYTIKSSVPVLAYVINSIDKDKVRSSMGLPIYDWSNQKYDHSGVWIAFPTSNSPQQYQHPSDLQAFNVTFDKDGSYALAIDTRIYGNQNNQQTNIGASTVDVTFSIQKIVNGISTRNSIPVIGTTSVYGTDEYGNIDYTKNIITNH